MSLALLRELKLAASAHGFLHFPSGRPQIEWGAIDIASQAELDAFLSGYIDRIQREGSLSPLEDAQFHDAAIELENSLETLSGQVRMYFKSLSCLANVAVSYRLDQER